MDDAAFGRSIAARTLPTLTKVPTAAAISADGRWLLERGSDAPDAPPYHLVLGEVVRGEDGASARAVAAVDLPEEGVGSRACRALIALSGDGSVAVTCRAERELVFWSLTPHAPTRVTPVATVAMRRRVVSLALSDDGSLAVAGDFGNVSVWRVVRGAVGIAAAEHLGSFEASKSVVVALGVATRADGAARVVSVGWEETPVLWRVRMDANAASADREAPREPFLEALGAPIIGAETGESSSSVSLTRDARLAVIGSDWDGALFRVATDAALRIGDSHPAIRSGFSPDGLTFLANTRTEAMVWRIHEGGVRRVAAMPLPDVPMAAGFAAGDAWVYVGARGPASAGRLFALPPAAWQRRSVRIGYESILWEPPPEPRAGWSALEPTFAPPHSAGGRPELRVRNTGDGAAYRVVAELAVRLPGVAQQAPPQVIHFGTIAPGQTVLRTLAPLPTDVESYVQVTVTREGEPALTPLAWTTLPKPVGDAAALDRHAERIFAAAREVMRELIGDPTFEPQLARMDPDEVGFATNSGTIRYQNPYTMNAAGLATNRAIILPTSRAELLAEMELMLDIYIPHEMAHAARRHLGYIETDPWLEETIANLVGAALTERVLALQPTSPYTPETLHRAYDRYVARLAPRVSPEGRSEVENLIASGGRDRPRRDPSSMFQNDVATYVFVGARIAQYAVQTRLTLDQLRARYLSPSPTTPNP